MEKETRVCDLCPLQSLISRFAKSDVRKHLLGARKEILLAVKSLIESEIERTEEKTGGGKTSKVKVS
ncbi:MAG: hypothetical protein AB1401_09470 [Thermodesulfobacteriota bacterium]